MFLFLNLGIQGDAWRLSVSYIMNLKRWDKGTTKFGEKTKEVGKLPSG